MKKYRVKKPFSKKKKIVLIVVLAAVFVFFILAPSIFALYNYIKRDYRPGGREDYLDKITQEGASNQKKNVIIILLDDMGYGDLSCTGSQAISTPNIDALAEEGIFFTNYYAPNPICSASRAGLLTGRYPLRTLTARAYMDTETISGHFASLLQCFLGSYPYWNTGLPTDEILLPEILQAVGYNTALFGKWHLGVKDKERPNNRGFDYFLGALYSDDMKPYRVYENEKVIHKEPYDQTQMTKELTASMLDYISENKDEPFFLYYASPFPHWPAQVSEDFAATSKAGTYGDCMQEIDWSVGQIVQRLKEEGLEDDTLILFTSDNGPWYEGATGGQRGRKATKYNGGSHLPFIAYMPGTLPAGKVEEGLTSGLDIFPTILSMVGVELPTDRIIDGIDMWSAWKGESEPERTVLYMNDAKDSFAMVYNNFKYIERASSEMGPYKHLKQGPFLYDMATDPEEAYNVSMLYPDVADMMAESLKDFKKSLKDNVRGWIE